MPAVSGQFYPGTASGLSRALLALTREVKDAGAGDRGRRPPRGIRLFGGRGGGSLLLRPGARAAPSSSARTTPGSGRMPPSCRTGHGGCRGGTSPSTRSSPPRLKTACPLLREDASAHSREHAIEVQLPFLHRFRPDVRIVPVALGRLSLEECRELGENVANAIAQRRRTSPAGRQLRHVPLRARRRRANEGPDGDRPDAGPRPRGALPRPFGPSGSRCAGCCRPRWSSSPPAVLARPRPV